MHILVLVVCYEEYLHRILSRLSPTEVRGPLLSRVPARRCPDGRHSHLCDLELRAG